MNNEGSGFSPGPWRKLYDRCGRILEVIPSGRIMDAVLIKKLEKELEDVLPDDRRGVSRVLSGYLGESYSSSVSTLLTYQLAGLPFTVPSDTGYVSMYGRAAERCVVYVEDLYPSHYLKRLEGSFLCLTGTMAGKRYSKRVTRRMARFILSMNGAGYSNKNVTSEDLGGLMFETVLNPEHQKILMDFFRNDKTAEDNRRMIKKRSRGCVIWQGNPCEPCWKGRDSCPLSRISRDLPHGECGVPDRKEHKGRLASGVCLECHRRMIKYYDMV